VSNLVQVSERIDQIRCEAERQQHSSGNQSLTVETANRFLEGGNLCLTHGLP